MVAVLARVVTERLQKFLILYVVLNNLQFFIYFIIQFCKILCESRIKKHFCKSLVVPALTNNCIVYIIAGYLSWPQKQPAWRMFLRAACQLLVPTLAHHSPPSVFSNALLRYFLLTYPCIVSNEHIL